MLLMYSSITKCINIHVVHKIIHFIKVCLKQFLHINSKQQLRRLRSVAEESYERTGVQIYEEGVCRWLKRDYRPADT